MILILKITFHDYYFLIFATLRDLPVARFRLYANFDLAYLKPEAMILMPSINSEYNKEILPVLSAYTIDTLIVLARRKNNPFFPSILMIQS